MRQFWMLLAGVLFAGAAVAAETTKGEFAKDQSALSTVTAPAMGGIGGDAEALTSMKGTGKVRIGGDVILRYAYSRVKDTGRWGGSGTMHASEWEPDTANLDFEITACDNGKLFISLDLTDPWYDHTGNGAAISPNDQDDILDQIYFTLENLCGTGFGVTFGKSDIPFGMGRDDLALHPYMSGYGETFLQPERNGWFNAGGQTDYEGPHSISYDPRFAFIPFFKFNDTLKIEAAVFQDSYTSNSPWNGRRQMANGRNTRDPGFSFAGRITWNPIEDLEISGSAVTRYNRTGNNAAGFNDRTAATSIGFDWKPCFFSKKFDLYAEWQHAWDPEFQNNTSSDNILAGLSFDVTEAITLYTQYEWLRTRNQNNVRAWSYQQLQRALVAAQYSFASGMYIEAGYQHEWGTRKIDGGGNDRKAYADVLYTAFGWSF